MSVDIYTTPVLQPPEGQESIFGGPYNSIQIGTVIAFSVTYFLATCFVGLRYFQALHLSKKLEADLVLITLSYGVSMGYFITLINMVNHGWGKRMWNVSIADFAILLEGFAPNSIMYLIAPSLSRIAMLSILYHINPSIRYRCITIGLGLAIVIYTVALCILVGGPCSITSGNDKCLQSATEGHAFLSVIFDLAIILLPLPTIHQLNLPPKQKLMVVGLLTLGSSVFVCTLIRLPWIIIIKNRGGDVYNESFFLCTWSTIEINLGIVCVCASRMKPLFTLYFPRLGTLSSYSRGSERQSWTKSLKLNHIKNHNSYQLHSVQGPADGIELERRDIRVDRSYQVHVEYTARPESNSGSVSGSAKGILQ